MIKSQNSLLIFIVERKSNAIIWNNVVWFFPVLLRVFYSEKSLKEKIAGVQKPSHSPSYKVMNNYYVIDVYQ